VHKQTLFTGDFLPEFAPGMTPNTIAQTSAKVVMASCFLGLVGALPPEEQNLWLPNQVVYDPDTWTAPHLLQLKREYDILVDKYGCLVQEKVTVQDPPAPPSDILLLPPLNCLHTDTVRIQELPLPGESRPVLPPSQRTLSRQLMRIWEVWKTNIEKSTDTGCSNNWLFTHNKLLSLLVLKISTHVLERKKNVARFSLRGFVLLKL